MSPSCGQPRPRHVLLELARVVHPIPRPRARWAVTGVLSCGTSLVVPPRMRRLTTPVLTRRGPYLQESRALTSNFWERVAAGPPTRVTGTVVAAAIRRALSPLLRVRCSRSSSVREVVENLAQRPRSQRQSATVTTHRLLMAAAVEVVRVRSDRMRPGVFTTARGVADLPFAMVLSSW